MYIVAIGWLYVTLMMAITEKNILAGVMTFVFYGLAPCSILLWLMGTPGRARARCKAARQDTIATPTAENSVDKPAHESNRTNTERD